MQSTLANNLRISYLDVGSGPTLILLHGFSLDHTMWENQIRLLEKKYRIIAPDLRGSGLTGNSFEEVSIQLMADDMSALINTLSLKSVAIAGFSMGGYILLEMILRNPRTIRAAAFLSTRASADSIEGMKKREEQMIDIINRGTKKFAKKFSPELFGEIFAKKNPENVQKIEDIISKQSPENVSKLLNAIRLRQDHSLRLQEINIPCAVIGGTEDRLIPKEDFQELNNCLQNSTFHLLEHIGHMTPLESPDSVSFILDELLQNSGMWI
tara:strand:- start:19174 stop:19977 length:804 start_codon:yes stop_codon:yes gene_type:complete